MTPSTRTPRLVVRQQQVVRQTQRLCVISYHRIDLLLSGSIASPPSTVEKSTTTKLELERKGKR